MNNDVPMLILMLYCSGYLVNNDVPMNVGFEDNTYFFEGMMDEVGGLHTPHNFAITIRTLSKECLAAHYIRHICRT